MAHYLFILSSFILCFFHYSGESLAQSSPTQAFDQRLLLPEGFVYVDEIIPDIIVDLRYFGKENFMGRPAEGYYASYPILTRQAAEALKKAQDLADKTGYRLVLYDGYRPNKAVKGFWAWAEDMAALQRQRDYYPTITNKKQLFERGYVAKPSSSSHTRGSTVDVTVIKKNKAYGKLTWTERTLTNGETIPVLDDGTLDMGTSFDLFHEASHTDSQLVEPHHQQNRLLLKKIMNEAGFKNLREEWWHYTLEDEPYPETYFDFDIGKK